MTYIVTSPCVDVLDKSCIDVCPVDCIYIDEGVDRMVFIAPDECVSTAPRASPSVRWSPSSPRTMFPSMRALTFPSTTTTSRRTRTRSEPRSTSSLLRPDSTPVHFLNCHSDERNEEGSGVGWPGRLRHESIYDLSPPDFSPLAQNDICYLRFELASRKRTLPLLSNSEADAS